MILNQPLQGLMSPSLVALLEKLYAADSAVSGRELGRRASISAAQANTLLRKLVSLGLVFEQAKPPALLYELNRSHALVTSLQPLFEFQTLRDEWLAMQLAVLNPKPLAAIIFGSVARSEDDELSDLDLYLLFDDLQTASDENYQSQLQDLRESFFSRFGNDLEIVSSSMSELSESISSRKRFARHLFEEGRPIFGATLVSDLARETPWTLRYSSA